MNLKKIVGYEAVEWVKDGYVIGLGTGSTTHYFIEKLAEKIKNEELEVLGIPTSYQSFFLASDSGIPLTTLEEHDVDLAVDGADEVDPLFNLIKGGGAAHTMEKIIDQSADKFIVIVDDSKMVDVLGKFPIPVEVIPPALRIVKEQLMNMGGQPDLRMAERKDGPVISDNGNFIVDVKFDGISEPGKLEVMLNSIPGVVENGVFAGLADEVLVATTKGLNILKRV
jgi:ribose 5-phosphate isomerase A